MQQHQADMQVICTIPVMFSYWAKANDALKVSQFLNDDIATTFNTYPDKFIGLATVPMQDTKLAIIELERCMKLGYKGVQIGSNINNLNLNEPQFDEFFAACENLNAAILIHPWQMMGQEQMTKYWLPWLVGMPAETSLAICSMIFGGVFERLPNLRVAFAHGGGSFPSTIGRIEHGFHCRPDLVAVDNKRNPREYLGKFYFDSLVHDAHMLRYLIELVGEKRIALGSDYPFPLGEDIPGSLVESMNDLPENVKARILSGTAAEWLNLNIETVRS